MSEKHVICINLTQKTYIMQLPANTLLQGGKYRIIKCIGQGGFGITYEAMQSGLDRKVAIKEFFMKDFCEREDDATHVTIGTRSSRDMVANYRNKFIKEAKTIAALNNAHIIRIYDIFEENNTAYYVMEYLGGGSLKEKSGLGEKQSVAYILQVADALQYIHDRRIMHLDVKPSNIMLQPGGEAVLIDFGVSKRYDDGGGQTSSTPVGISKGYAPLEQYVKDGISTFSPATDIYSLGATLYFLLTGEQPPEAGTISDEGLPPLPPSVSLPVRRAVEAAMQPRRKDRPQSATAFAAMLDDKRNDEDESTHIMTKPAHRPTSDAKESKQGIHTAITITAILAAAVAALVLLMNLPKKQEPVNIEDWIEAPAEETSEAEKNKLAGEEFLRKNAQRQGVETTPSGLQYEIVSHGTGPKPGPDSKVKVEYSGWLIDGTVFDETSDKPVVFRTSQVIEGWTEALQMMPVGSVWNIYVPYNMAYKDRGFGQIKPYSALCFRIHLMDIIE